MRRSPSVHGSESLLRTTAALKRSSTWTLPRRLRPLPETPLKQLYPTIQDPIPYWIQFLLQQGDPLYHYKRTEDSVQIHDALLDLLTMHDFFLLETFVESPHPFYDPFQWVLFYAQEDCIPLLRSLLERELNRSDIHTLLRGNSMAIKFLSMALKVYGSSFLVASMKPPLDQLLLLDVGVELDPKIVFPLFWKSLVTCSIPSPVLVLLHTLSECIAKISTDHISLAVSTVFFLRFVCVALTLPVDYQLCTNITPRLQKCLLGVSKLLYACALEKESQSSVLKPDEMKQFLEKLMGLEMTTNKQEMNALADKQSAKTALLKALKNSVSLVSVSWPVCERLEKWETSLSQLVALTRLVFPFIHTCNDATFASHNQVIHHCEQILILQQGYFLMALVPLNQWDAVVTVAATNGLLDRLAEQVGKLNDPNKEMNLMTSILRVVCMPLSARILWPLVNELLDKEEPVLSQSIYFMLKCLLSQWDKLFPRVIRDYLKRICASGDEASFHATTRWLFEHHFCPLLCQLLLYGQVSLLTEKLIIVQRQLQQISQSLQKWLSQSDPALSVLLKQCKPSLDVLMMRWTTTMEEQKDVTVFHIPYGDKALAVVQCWKLGMKLVKESNEMIIHERLMSLEILATSILL